MPRRSAGYGPAPKGIHRILDVNFNRSREGLRVCEEIARFVLKDRQLTERLKDCRHRVSSFLKADSGRYTRLVRARDSASDPGRPFSPLERERRSLADLFIANLQRAKESLRVLEEGAKLYGEELPAHFKEIRYQLYDIEKSALPRLEAVFGDRSENSPRPATRASRRRGHLGRGQRRSAAR